VVAFAREVHVLTSRFCSVCVPMQYNTNVGPLTHIESKIDEIQIISLVVYYLTLLHSNLSSKITTGTIMTFLSWN